MNMLWTISHVAGLSGKNGRGGLTCLKLTVTRRAPSTRQANISSREARSNEGAVGLNSLISCCLVKPWIAKLNSTCDLLDEQSSRSMDTVLSPLSPRGYIRTHHSVPKLMNLPDCTKFPFGVDRSANPGKHTIFVSHFRCGF